MTSESKSPLPVLDKPYPPDLNAFKVGAEWFKSFAAQVESKNVAGILSKLREDAFWRDTLAMTYDFRTFHGTSDMKKFLIDRLELSDLKQLKYVFASLDTTCPELPWVQGIFTFQIGELGAGKGVFRLIPDSTGEWKAYTIYTTLESLKGYPEKVGPYRNAVPDHGKWLENRRKEIEFEDEEPYVVVVGGAHNGLDIAARLKFLDVPTLIIEKEANVGDNWKGRYEALCLHDPVWFNHMPYIPFPDTWPVYSPSQKLAGWLESFAHSLELNVWTSSAVTSVTKDPKTQRYNVVVRRGNGQERTLHPVHVVFAVGLMSGTPTLPEYPGKADFQGRMIHSSQHKTARDHIGKKVVVVAAGNSAHDICADHVEYGVDVTMYQRSSIYIMSQKATIGMFRGYAMAGIPTEIKDVVSNSYPRKLVKWVHQRTTKEYAKVDKEMLEGLDRVGFKYNFGEDGSGLLTLAWTRAGGYYINMGASEMVIDGRIKLKNDSLLQGFTKNGLKFEDGSEIEGVDVVIFATGFQPIRDAVRKICGEELGSQLKPIWGLDGEGELNSAFRDCGVANMWFMLGNLATARYYSQHVALQIKAMKEGVFAQRYSREHK